MNGLEPVSKGLLSRYNASAGKVVVSVLCYELLYPCEDHDPLKPLQTENKKLSLDLFPWFTQDTTYPTCRRDVDPDSLTIKGGNAGWPWVPPAKGKLEAWVQAEEEKRSSCNGSTTLLA